LRVVRALFALLGAIVQLGCVSANHEGEVQDTYVLTANIVLGLLLALTQ
jgi:hypothetical protein